MICSFCANPAAHPATGCVYGPRTIACHQCVIDCWTWVLYQTNARIKKRPAPASGSFYEAAGRWE